jgi:hypothetical protein
MRRPRDARIVARRLLSVPFGFVMQSHRAEFVDREDAAVRAFTLLLEETGPRDESFTAIAMASRIGARPINAVAANMRSKISFFSIELAESGEATRLIAGTPSRSITPLPSNSARLRTSGMKRIFTRSQRNSPISEQISGSSVSESISQSSCTSLVRI